MAAASMRSESGRREAFFTRISLQVQEPACVGTQDLPLVGVGDVGREDLSQLRSRIHQRLIRTEQNSIGPGSFNQLFDGTGGAKSGAGFEEDIGVGVGSANSISALRRNVASMSGDEVGVRKARC